MAERFFVEKPIGSERVVLTGGQAHHLGHVMRAEPGQLVTLFDGSGCDFLARVERVGPAEVELAVIERRPAAGAPRFPLTLAVALPKGDRQRWLVEKAVELGVARLTPVIAKHSVALPIESALARLRRIVVEASKQCGRGQLMEITNPAPFAELIAADAGAALRLILHPSGPALREVWPAPPGTGASNAAAESRGIVAAIGPEGGFAPEEIDLALSAGWTAASLGNTILRVETAALALAAWCALQAA